MDPYRKWKSRSMILRSIEKRIRQKFEKKEICWDRRFHLDRDLNNFFVLSLFFSRYLVSSKELEVVFSGFELHRGFDFELELTFGISYLSFGIHKPKAIICALHGLTLAFCKKQLFGESSLMSLGKSASFLSICLIYRKLRSGTEPSSLGLRLIQLYPLSWGGLAWPKLELQFNNMGFFVQQCFSNHFLLICS